LENNTDVVALRQQGLTLKEIGQILGVSRERVRQILAARGGPSDEEVSIAKQKRLHLRHQVIQEQVQMLMDQGIFQMSVIEANLNLPRYQIRSAISPDLAAKIVRTSHQKKLWTDERIMDSIRQASDGVAMFSTKQYADALKSGKISGPTLAVIFHRYGSWKSACDLAGVKSRDVKGRPKATSKVRAIADLSAFLEQVTGSITASKYEKWAALNKKVSLGTLRNLFGSWANAVITARTFRRL
jgi:transcriptional regulator with XRE-family HTH domain